MSTAYSTVLPNECSFAKVSSISLHADKNSPPKMVLKSAEMSRDVTLLQNTLVLLFPQVRLLLYVLQKWVKSYWFHGFLQGAECVAEMGGISLV